MQCRKEIRKTQGIVEDFIHSEKTVLAIMLYSDNVNAFIFQRVFSCTHSGMFSDKNLRKIYEIIKDSWQSDEKILGTKHFAYKVNLIMNIESEYTNNCVFDLESDWSPTQTLDYWLSKVQENYFSARFKNAQNEKEFYEIIAEKDKYQIIDDMDSISDGGETVLKEYDKRRKNSVFTAYKSINQYIGSLQGGDMIILAGAASGGKTCMMLNIILGIAKQGKCVDIFSLEMPKAQLQQRIICSEAQIDAHKFRAFDLSEDEINRFDRYATHEFKNLNIRIFKKQTVDIEGIKRIERKSKSDIVFIDYLGLIDGAGNKNSYEKFSEISRSIKLLAMECNKPIVALHQLNRAFQDREDKRPRMSDLRDSGKIEQDADMIWFVHRPALFDCTKAPDEMEFIIAKNRHGETNKIVPMRFIGKFQKVLERSV